MTERLKDGMRWRANANRGVKYDDVREGSEAF